MKINIDFTPDELLFVYQSLIRNSESNSEVKNTILDKFSNPIKSALIHDLQRKNYDLYKTWSCTQSDKIIKISEEDSRDKKKNLGEKDVSNKRKST